MLTSTPQPNKNSDMACTRTIEKRNRFLRDQVKSTSGSTNGAFTTQTSQLLKSCEKETREDILKMANITHTSISPEEIVSMKAHLGIPWEKLKTMSR